MAHTSMDDPDGEWTDDSGAHERDGARAGSAQDDGRRELHDRMPIDPFIDTAAALHRMPAHWLAAACRILAVEPTQRASRNRRARSAALLTALRSPRCLVDALSGLSTRSRSALRTVLESGGCVALIMLTQEFGSMDGDGWSWDARPPASCLGELRCRALLHIGCVRIEQDGGLPDLHVPIAVVPQDLRAPLCTLLGVPEDQPWADPEPVHEPDDLQSVLRSMQRYFDLPDAAPEISHERVAEFLRTCAQNGRAPGKAWQHIHLLFEFAAHNMHEISSVEELCDFHLSELATDFVERRQGQRWLLAQRRELVETTAAFYAFLHQNRLISEDAHEQIARAAHTLLSGKRRLNLIRRPPPVGGEAVFLYEDDGATGRRTYTVNHRRVAVAWWSLCDQDWDSFLIRCGGVVDGERKAQIARELMNADASVCDLLLACAEEDEPESVVSWFEEHPLLLARAW